MPPGSEAPLLELLSPMLLVERRTLPAGDDWQYEIKYDGYRVLASTGPAAQLRSRGGADASRWFPEIVASLKELAAGSILDGEVCVLDEIGRSDFERLQARARRRRLYEGADLVAYCVFDVLVANGADIRGRTLEDRRRSLAEILDGPRSQLLLVQSVADGQWLYDSALALGLEGIVGKRMGSTYQAGARSQDWFKLKRPGAVPAQRFKR